VIVYDDAVLFPDLASRLGDAAVGVVVAHEYGHAIQARAKVFDEQLPTVDTEQQADCFAGAWSAHVARGESELLPAFGDEEVKAGLAAMIEVRDPVGTSAFDPNAHGTAFDRVGAFQEGFLKGPQRCRDFTRGQPNPRIDLEFTDEEQLSDDAGDLPYDDILAALPKSLDTFWVPTLQASKVEFTPPTLVSFPTDGPYPQCRGLTGPELKNRVVFCPESNTIAYDENFVRDLYDRLGDMAFAYPIASAYSDSVQTTLGFTLTGEPEVLLNDCLVGSWLVDIVPIPGTDPPDPTNPSQEIVLSAGDLDEVVLTAVLLGDAATDTDLVGTAFEKIDAFRTGVLEGLAGCQARLG
jgi:predicted metalloprotease